MAAAALEAQQAPHVDDTVENMEVDAVGGSVAVAVPVAAAVSSPAAVEQQQQNNKNKRPKKLKKKRITFVGSEYIEYDTMAAPAVRLCGVSGMRMKRTDADVALEWRARGHGDSAKAANLGQAPPADAAALRAQLESEYEREMRDAMEERGLPCLDDCGVAVREQYRISELLVAWSIIASDHHHDAATAAESVPDKTSELLSSSESLDEQHKRLELLRKQVFGPVVDGYVFGRRFFSIDSFLLTLELEELVALAESHAIQVPQLPQEVLGDIKVADRELIATYSATGMGKPLKMLTFRELVEEAYARGILLEDVRDAMQKKSKRAWVDVLRPTLHAEMLAFKIREAHTELIHDHLVAELEVKMRSARTGDIVQLVRSYLHSQPSVDTNQRVTDMHRYFQALVHWYDATTATQNQENQQQNQQDQQQNQQEPVSEPTTLTTPPPPATPPPSAVVVAAQTTGPSSPASPEV